MKSCDSCQAVWEGGQPSTCTCDFDPSCGAAAIQPTIAGQMRALRCIEALAELVRLKHMKQHCEAMQAAGTMLEQDYALKAEYEAGKDKAWQAAFDALEGE